MAVLQEPRPERFFEVESTHDDEIDDVAQIAEVIDRRTSLSLSITHGELYLSIGDRTFTLAWVEHRLT